MQSNGRGLYNGFVELMPCICPAFVRPFSLYGGFFMKIRERLLSCCMVTTFCLMTSCTVSVEQTVPGYSILEHSSLKEYADKGFLITPSQTYGANYNSIGFISLKKMSDAKSVVIEVEKTINPGGKRTELVEERGWDAPAISLEERDLMLEQLYEVAISQGADAIINFETELIERKLTGPPHVQTGWRVSGFAIDRLD